MSGSDPPSLSSDSHLTDTFLDRFSVQVESRPPSPVLIDAPINPVFERRTLRKVDRHLLPVLAVLYSLAFIDATNLAIARREGADREFKLLVDQRYYIVSFVFYLPYILIQLPFNLALRRVGAAMWLGTVTFLLGAVQIALAFVNGWGQLLGVRAIIGLLEAVILPGCVYLISCWYTRRELHKRVSLFYSASVFVSSFANILGLGLSKIRVRSLPGWRWIFAVEGLVTVLLSFYGYLAVMSFPDRKCSSFEPIFSQDEIRLMRQRIELDRRDYAPDTLDGENLRIYLTDLALWAYGFLVMCAMMAVYSFSLFLPVSLPGLHFSNIDSQLLFIPAGVIATFSVIVTGFLSDRQRVRGPFIVFHFILTTIGLCMVGFSGFRGVKFTGCIFIYSGAQANVSTILTYQANNVRLHSKRLVAVSLVASFAGVGGLLSVLAFPISAAPDYTAGLWVTLALQIAGMVVAVLLMGWLRWENTKMVPTTEPARGDAREGHGTRPGTPGPEQSRRRVREREVSIEGLEGFQYTI